MFSWASFHELVSYSKCWFSMTYCREICKICDNKILYEKNREIELILRWQSLVLSSSTKWGASIQRFGAKFDHSLLIRWTWRLRVSRQKPKPDFAIMSLQQWQEFNAVLKAELVQGIKDVYIDEAEAMGWHYTFFLKCVYETIEKIVSRMKRHTCNGRTK